MKFKKVDLKMWRVRATGDIIVFWYGQSVLAGYAAKVPGKRLGTPFYVRGNAIRPMTDSGLDWKYWKDNLDFVGEFFS